MQCVALHTWRKGGCAGSMFIPKDDPSFDDFSCRFFGKEVPRHALCPSGA